MYNEHLTDYIEGHFKECLKPGVSFTPEYYPHIPEKHLAKAKKHFVNIEEGETVLMLFDTSLFSKGKNGLALTDRAVYFRDMFSSAVSVKYRNWRPDRDETGTILKISAENPLILSPFLDKLLNEICTIKTYDGLFEQEEKSQEEAEAKAAEEKAAAEAKAAEEAAARAAAKEAEKKAEEEDDDENDDDEESGAGMALEFLGIVMDVTSDPTYE
jgi:hypothetical protein